jgi:hypothetical protein
LIFEIKYNIVQSIGNLVYYSDEFSLDTIGRKNCGYTSVLVNDIHLEINEFGVVCAIWGICPEIHWEKSSISLPLYSSGSLIVHEKLCPGVSVRVNIDELYWNVKYDIETGWLLLCEKKMQKYIDVVEFLPNCIAALQDKRLVCIWLKPEIL